MIRSSSTFARNRVRFERSRRAAVAASLGRGSCLGIGASLAFVVCIAFPTWGLAQTRLAPLVVLPDTPTIETQLAEDGFARVIVRLHAPRAPEGSLSQQATWTQRARIDAAQDAILATTPGTTTVLRRYASFPALAAIVDATALRALQADATVLSIEPDRLTYPTLGESTKVVHADPTAWDLGFDGSGWMVAVLDTGVDTTHAAFAGKTIVEACFSSTFGYGGTNTVTACPNGQQTQFGPGAAAPPSVPGAGHGTHVAGIAVGNAGGVTGVAKDADLIAVQVFSVVAGCTGGDCVTAWSSDILAALDYVNDLTATYDVASANLSLGGGRYTGPCGTETVIANLRSHGVATLAASGNDGWSDAMAYPACLTGAISVGSTDDGSIGTTLDAVSGYSNAAWFLDLLAPGKWIGSSVPGGGYEIWAGTSMATPHASGAWAIVREAHPTMSVDDVLATFQSEGVPVLDGRNGLSFARLDLAYLESPTLAGADLAFVGTPSVAPSDAQAGDAIEICWTWQNVGDDDAVTGDASEFVPVRGYRDDDMDPGAVFTTESAVASGVAPGAGGSACAFVTTDAVPGDHVAYLHVDPDAEVAESNEANNLATVAYTVRARPVNDDFEQREALPSGSANVPGRTVNATAQPGEPAHAGTAAHASIWFRWTPPATGYVTFRTQGSSFDTVLAAYRGGTLSALLEVASNDDVDAGTTWSEIRFLALPEVSYALAVDGAGTAAGDVTLSSSFAPIDCPFDPDDLPPLGDVDGDGSVLGADALRVLRMATGSWVPPEASDPLFRHVDLTADGTVTLQDVVRLLAKASDPDVDPILHVWPGSLQLALEETACILVGNAGGASLPSLGVSVEGNLVVLDVTPEGANGRVYAVARVGTGAASVTIEGGPAGSVTVPVGVP